jgi:DNA polymerase
MVIGGIPREERNGVSETTPTSSRRSGGAADALARLHRGVAHCRKCPLHEGRTRAVPGEGPADAAVLLVGEGPGEAEDRTGRPFCGRAGEHLDETLRAAGLARERLYITSTVKCRPPRNRTPKPEERATCRAAWLDDQIRLVDPGLVVLLGRTAAELFHDGPVRIADAHGRPETRGGRSWLIAYHPAAAMRFPAAAGGFRADMAAVADWLRRRSAGR